MGVQFKHCFFDLGVLTLYVGQQEGIWPVRNPRRFPRKIFADYGPGM